MSGRGDLLAGSVSRSDDPAAVLSRRYRTALLAVALLAVVNQALVQPSLWRLASDAPRINMAGRQRMLSQRLAKAALALDAARTDAQRRRHRDELASVLDLWSTAHELLRRGAGRRALAGPDSAPIAAALDALLPSYTRMRDAAATLARGTAARSASLEALLAAEPEYLDRMDRIVGLYEGANQERVRRLLWTGWGLTALMLLGLAGIGGLVVRPAARLIRLQISALREARDALEARVIERTAALEQAARNRAEVEERHRALLEQLSHAARTTTVGEMASGLAHELNQPLGAIANYAEGCLVALDNPGTGRDDLRAPLEKVLATTLRAGQIVKRIRRFVTRHEPTREPVDPNRLVAEVDEFFREQARTRRIALQTQLAPDLPQLLGDPVQIQQVLVNLVRNALEAISASKIEAPTVVMTTAATPSGAVEFAVTDNGEGIPEARRPQVFDAFFSTRDEGMGMGLAISRTIVEAHHGRIWVESEPGVRTTFRFTIPPGDGDRDDASNHVLEEGTDGLHRG